jgi:transposase
MRRRERLELSVEEREELGRISRSRKESLASVRRARILLLYANGKRICEIANEMGTNRPLIERAVDKALSFGALQALKDLPRPGRPPVYTDDARVWVLSVACTKPVDLGYADETWSYSLLVKHIRRHCDSEGHPCLRRLGKGQLHAILSRSNVKPHKVTYYLERRDPEFAEKMANVLCVYRQVAMHRLSRAERTSTTVSYDEKPGIQAVKNIGADLLPAPGKHATIGRDCQYRRLGTVSLLAGIDLHTGEVIPLVRERHRSREFVEFLGLLDEKYPSQWEIRVVLDNHSSHISKETQAYLRTNPKRFRFVFTPKHGSWLNMIEILFSKMARSFLRHIRVQSKEELIERIHRGIEQMNEEPVIFRWHYKMSEIALA